MAELKEAWTRVQRFRDRYRTVLESAPADLLSFAQIPDDRRRDIGQWFGDCADFGINCCVYLHHLVDWSGADPSVPASKQTLQDFVRLRRRRGPWVTCATAPNTPSLTAGPGILTA